MPLAATCVCDGDIYGPIESALSRATWTKTSDSPGETEDGVRRDARRADGPALG